MQRINRLSVLAIVAACVALASIPAAAEPAQWDQAAVTAIGKQLATATSGWWQAVRQQGGDTVGDGDAQPEFGIANKARTIDEMGEGLSARLAAGQGHDETVDMYRSLKEVVDDTQVLTEQAELDQPTIDAWAKVQAAMGQLAPYYEPKAKAR